jgi:thiosulfate/3-mercaptopyruvate sulfurtransferase
MVAAAAPSASAQRTDGADSVIVSSGWLAKHLNDPSIVVVQVGHDSSAYVSGHIPGARFVLYQELTAEANGVHTELPPVEKLTEVAERLGISNGSRVVFYPDPGGMGPMASRAFFTLDYLGHARTSILDGGITTWENEHRSESKELVHAVRTTYTAHPRLPMVSMSEAATAMGCPAADICPVRASCNGNSSSPTQKWISSCPTANSQNCMRRVHTPATRS